MENNKQSAGKVELPLDEYLVMRDTINKLLETTKTHKEFIKEFRTSLLRIVTEAEKIGLDLNPMVEYYMNLDFKPIEKLEFVETEDSTKLIIKTVEDENRGLRTITN